MGRIVAGNTDDVNGEVSTGSAIRVLGVGCRGQRVESEKGGRLSWVDTRSVLCLHFYTPHTLSPTPNTLIALPVLTSFWRSRAWSLAGEFNINRVGNNSALVAFC